MKSRACSPHSAKMTSIRLHPDKQTAAQAIAREIADLIEIRSKSGKTTVLGLATGSTPLPLYAELIRLHRDEKLSFRSVITFNLDEYAGLGPSHPQSYRFFMEENLSAIWIFPRAISTFPTVFRKMRPRIAPTTKPPSARPAGLTSKSLASVAPATSVSTNRPPLPTPVPAGSTSMR